MKNEGIVVDGKVYENDTFYLLKPTSIDDKKYNSEKYSSGIYLDRRCLLASLDLIGIIASTYSFDTDWFCQNELPHPNIPTLILMDNKKGSTSSYNNKKRKPPPNTSTTSFLQKRVKKRMQSPIFSFHPTTDATTKTKRPNNYTNVHISKVAPSYYDASLKKRKRMLGVCHSKYMILFERSGSIVLFISTANLTRPMSTDACWLQRFHLNKQEPNKQQDHHHHQHDGTTNRQMEQNDFQQVWYDFLQAQSKCIVSTSTDNDTNAQMTPWTFLQTYRTLLPPRNKSISSFKEWIQSYNWNTSHVFLVSTIPGKFSSSNTKIAYGAQRIAQIQQQRISSWTSPPPSSQQQLIFQPTSLGGGQWTRQHLLTILQSYCNITDSVDLEEEELFQRVSILWPSMDYMKQVSSSNRKHGVDCHTHAFLSTKSFNELNLDILSRMYIYTTNPSVCPPIDNTNLSIHFKSYLQCLGASKHQLAWFLLTSACFSKGAQGQLDSKSMDKNNNYDTIMTYSNFELGILFASRLQGNPKTDRLYTTMEQETDTTSDSTTKNIISLPIPYCIHRMVPYQHTNEMDFQVTPYFHEITPGTATVGQMALTPYGKRRIKEQKNKEHK